MISFQTSLPLFPLAGIITYKSRFPLDKGFEGDLRIDFVTKGSIT
jgi:hypothetical protein